MSAPILHATGPTTGWRQMPLEAGITGAVILARDGQTVHMALSNVATNTAGNANIIALPPGFRLPVVSGVNWRNGVVVNSAGSEFRVLSFFAGFMRILGMPSATQFNGYCSFVTPDPWPTVLPGTPA